VSDFRGVAHFSVRVLESGNGAKLMAIEWLIPAGKFAYDHREIAFSTWDKAVERVFGPKSKIAIVGPGGVGKTVLLDHLTGVAKRPGYCPPGRSNKTEYGKAKSKENRLGLVVAPGQGGPQIHSFNEIFSDKKSSADGVIFTACSGFVTLRSKIAIDASIGLGYDTIEKWREYQTASELVALREIVGHIRSSQAKVRKPKWLLVAVTKADLLYMEMDVVRKYYSPFMKSEFAKILDDLRLDVGRDNFEWDAVPVCSQLDDFHWGNEKKASELNESDRDHYLTQIAARIGELCQ